MDNLKPINATMRVVRDQQADGLVSVNLEIHLRVTGEPRSIYALYSELMEAEGPALIAKLANALGDSSSDQSAEIERLSTENRRLRSGRASGHTPDITERWYPREIVVGEAEHQAEILEREDPC